MAHMPANRPMTGPEWTTLLALSGLWGGSFFFNAVALRDLPVLVVVVARVGLGALFLLALLRVTGQRMPTSRRVWVALLGMGLLNNVIPFSLIVWGQTQIASGTAAIINAATPLFGVLLAHGLTTDERLTAARLAGVLVGFGGVAVMMGGSLDRSGGALLGALACLAAAFSYACSGIFGRRFRTLGVAPMATAAGQLTASTLVLLPVMLVVDRPWTLPAPDAAAVGAILALAALSTALAYVLFFRLLATAGATNLLLVTLLIPASAVLLGVLFLGETFLPRQGAGMALIALGLAAIDGRPWAAIRRRCGLTPAGGA